MENRSKPVELYYEHCVPDMRDPNLSPIVFVHGICDSSKTWSKVMKRIANETCREAYAIDLRNHGKSEWDDQFGQDTACTDIKHFLDQKGIRKCIFVSHSLGARFCMEITLKNPQLVEKIIAEDSSLNPAGPEDITMITKLMGSLRWMNLLPKSMTEMGARSLLSKRFAQIMPESPDNEFLAHFPLTRDRDGVFHVGFNIDAMERFVADERVVNLNFEVFSPYEGPTLLIYGSKSLMLKNKDEIIPKYFPHAEYYIVEGVGHFVHYERQKIFVEKVCDFINK